MLGTINDRNIEQDTSNLLNQFINENITVVHHTLYQRKKKHHFGW